MVSRNSKPTPKGRAAVASEILETLEALRSTNALLVNSRDREAHDARELRVQLAAAEAGRDELAREVAQLRAERAPRGRLLVRLEDGTELPLADLRGTLAPLERPPATVTAIEVRPRPRAPEVTPARILPSEHRSSLLCCEPGCREEALRGRSFCTDHVDH